MSAKFPRGGGGAGPFLARSLKGYIKLCAGKLYPPRPVLSTNKQPKLLWFCKVGLEEGVQVDSS